MFPTQRKIDRLLEKIVSMLKASVTNWKYGFNGEKNTIGSPTHEATPMVSEDTLEVSPVSGYPSTCVPGSQTASSVVDQSFELEEGFPTSSEGAQSPIHRCFPKRVGCSLKASHSQCSVESGEVKTSHKHSKAKSSVSSFKIIRNQLLNQNLLIFTDNSLVVAYLNKQGGTHSQEMCALIWRIMAWANARGIQIRAKHIPGNLNVLADSLSRKGDSDRMGIESSSVQSDLPLLSSTSGRFVCNKVESQASNVCVSCPRQSGLGNRCIEHLLGGSGRLCVLSSGSHS